MDPANSITSGIGKNASKVNTTAAEMITSGDGSAPVYPGKTRTIYVIAIASR